MDLRWCEDFVCLARLRSFSRTAEARYVTQSAFSRRIRSLENWFGAPLIDRSLYPVALTEAGENFLPIATDIVRQVYEARANAPQFRQKTARTITFAAQHSLSLGFFAGWIEKIEKRIGNLDVRLVADNYYNAVQSLREGGCDFLLCFTHSKVATIPQDIFEHQVLGKENLIPVCAPDNVRQKPYFSLPGDDKTPTPYLSYGPHTFLGKVVGLILERQPCVLDLRYENAFGESLKSMALCGRGVAWLPENIIREELAAASLMPVGKKLWQEKLDIRLLRQHEKTTPLCDIFWKEAGNIS